MADRFEQEENLPKVQPSEEAPPPPPDSEQKLGKSMLMKVALASLLVAALVISIANVMRANQLRAQTEELEAEKNKLKEKNLELYYLLKKEIDEEYIIKYARDVLGMCFPDENVYYGD